MKNWSLTQLPRAGALSFTSETSLFIGSAITFGYREATCQEP